MCVYKCITEPVGYFLGDSSVRIELLNVPSSIESFETASPLWLIIFILKILVMFIYFGGVRGLVFIASVFVRSSSLKDTGGFWGEASEEQQGYRLPRATVHLHHVQRHGRCQGPVCQTVCHGSGTGGRSTSFNLTLSFQGDGGI